MICRWPRNQVSCRRAYCQVARRIAPTASSRVVAAQVREHLGVAHRAQGGEGGFESLLEELPRLPDEAGLEHRLEAQPDASLQLSAGDVEGEDPARARAAPVAVPPLALGDRFAGEVEDLQGADDAVAVVRVDAGGGRGSTRASRGCSPPGSVPPSASSQRRSPGVAAGVAQRPSVAARR